MWQKAHSLRITIYEICKSLPKGEFYRLRDQIERSSNSVADNIAEGNSAYYYNNKIKSFYDARKEAAETQNHIRNLEDKRYITSKMAKSMISEYEQITRGINGMIRRVSEKRDKNNSKGSRFLGN
ncbi:MAG: four helix bundle protein [Candidatus Saganbacteria bacterium]|nr:four helix bundle protein [Candidatus Saganbacteria bacterium]